MILWIESQETAVIALLVFGFCYAMTATIFIAAALISGRHIAVALKATTPTMLTPISVIAGLLIAFLASRVWANLDHANTYTAAEVTAIHETVVLADSLPPEARAAVRGAMQKYVQYLEGQDWPAMAVGGASLRQVPSDLTDALTSVLSLDPAKLGQKVAQQRAVIAIEQITEARRSRVLLSKTAIAPVQWLVILVVAALTMLIVGMVHVDRRATVAINLFILSTAIAACLVLLMVNDRPFAAGGVTVEPVALREIEFD